MAAAATFPMVMVPAFGARPARKRRRRLSWLSRSCRLFVAMLRAVERTRS